MAPLTVSKMKASFSRLTRGVIKSRKPVVVRTPHGLVQIAPYDHVAPVAPAVRKALRPLPREVELSNTLGESL